MMNNRDLIRLLHKYGARLGKALELSNGYIQIGNENQIETATVLKELFL